VTSERRDTGGCTSEANATTLTPLRDCAAGATAATSASAGATPSTSTSTRATAGAGAGTGTRAGGGGRAAGSRADITVLDVREDDVSVRALRLDLCGYTGRGGARATGDTRGGCIFVRRVVRVEPEHGSGVVIPDGERENHAAAEGIAELLEPAVLVEVVGVAEYGLLLGAEVLGDGVDGVDAGDVHSRVLDGLAVLDVDAADLRERTGGGVVVRQELGHDGERLAGINGETVAVECGVTHTEGVEVAAVSVTETSVPGAVVARAAGLLGNSARVRSVCSSIAVGLPNIHLTAAGTVVTSTSVGAGSVPALNVSLCGRDSVSRKLLAQGS
jgi:hypothetical protein